MCKGFLGNVAPANKRRSSLALAGMGDFGSSVTAELDARMKRATERRTSVAMKMVQHAAGFGEQPTLALAAKAARATLTQPK